MNFAKAADEKVLEHRSMADSRNAQVASDRPARRGRLVIKGLRKSFGGKVVYDGFDLELELGTFTSIFGPNGCGKSTLINMISGLMPRDGGTVLYDGRTIEETSISYVFQNYREALFPWKRAIDNIRYPLDRHGYPKKKREARIEQLIADFGIRIDLDAYPYMLSGGQQQAVSIIRSLALEPDVLFLDAADAREAADDLQEDRNDDGAGFARSGGGRPDGGQGSPADQAPFAGGGADRQ